MFFGKRFSSYHSDSSSGIEILVLSIIKNHDGTTGYDIIQMIKVKFGGMWHSSAGTIYPLLNRLSEKNFVKIQEITDKYIENIDRIIEQKDKEIMEI